MLGWTLYRLAGAGLSGMGLPLNSSSSCGKFFHTRCRAGKQLSTRRIRRGGAGFRLGIPGADVTLRSTQPRVPPRWPSWTAAAQAPPRNSHRRFTTMDTTPAAARLSVRWHKLAWLTVFAIWLALPTALRAQTQAFWSGTTNGSWTDPLRWSTNPFFPNNGQPTAATTYAANIMTSGTYTVTLNAPVTVD